VAKPTGQKEALGAAKALLKAGRSDEAFKAYEAILEQTPDDAAAHAAYGAALAKTRPADAEAHYRRASELEPANAAVQTELGRYLTRVGRFDEALELLEAVVAAEPENLRAITVLASAREGCDDLDGAFALYRRALELAPDKPGLYAQFATFLNRQAQNVAYQAVQLDPDSAGFAAAHGVALSRTGQFDEAAAAFERAEQINPGSVDLRRELLAIERLRHTGAVIHARPAPWPTRDFNFDDYEKAIRRYVLGEVPDDVKLVSKTTKVATMGSCFATHVAQRLQARGVDAFYKLIAEDINSTYANSYLLDWVLGVKDEQTSHFDALYGEEERLDWEKNLRDCDLFIFSLGLATSFFDRETGDFVLTVGGQVEGAALAQLYQHRNTTVGENVANVRHIIDKLRTLNPGVKVVLTVSPVALGGTYERKSAVLADCVSKSTLRVTVEEVLALGLPDVYYWPSFEMARWLGAHLPAKYDPPFGADDGRTRHVSIWLQDLIIGLFVEYYGDESLAAAPQNDEHGRLPAPGLVPAANQPSA
jgi:tetratricopeptide (TPR) repeat protein